MIISLLRLRTGFVVFCIHLLFAPLSIGQINLFVDDLSLVSGLQDNEGFGVADHLKRGRASICADFNNDGLVDMYTGNPGDESYVLVNQGVQVGNIATFAPSNLLLTGDLAWGGAAADYDEDGDIDLFVSIGGNEGDGLDYMFKNMLVETGTLDFANVTDQAGVAGQLDSQGKPIPTSSANAMFVDYDRDGDMDLWVNTNEFNSEFEHFQNVLWENQLRETGVATFEDVTADVGLTVANPARTFHSSWADFDQDGDMDLFENNFRTRNRLVKNMLVETGSANFVDVTAAGSLPGNNLQFPRNSFGSAVLDFNGDGFDDIFVNFRWLEDEPMESPHGNGHAIFINDGNGNFSDLTSEFVRTGFPFEGGVMGFMAGDLNGDAYPEIFLGQGGPMLRQENQFFVSNGSLDANGFPIYEDGSHLINFPAPESGDYATGYYPEYPYRTHGTTFVDTNGDGNLEIYVANGGRTADSDSVRDPNRHFFLDWGNHSNFVVRLIGDGIHVNRDGMGARLKLTVGSTKNSEQREIFRTVRGGNAFSAQNDIRSNNFGLGDSDVIYSLDITWPDGTIQTVVNGLEINTKQAFVYGESNILLGDVNLDGQVNLLDVGPFVAIIASGTYQIEADTNQDGVVDLLDIDPFIDILSG